MKMQHLNEVPCLEIVVAVVVVPRICRQNCLAHPGRPLLLLVQDRQLGLLMHMQQLMQVVWLSLVVDNLVLLLWQEQQRLHRDKPLLPVAETEPRIPMYS